MSVLLHIDQYVKAQFGASVRYSVHRYVCRLSGGGREYLPTKGNRRTLYFIVQGNNVNNVLVESTHLRLTLYDYFLPQYNGYPRPFSGVISVKNLDPERATSFEFIRVDIF